MTPQTLLLQAFRSIWGLYFLVQGTQNGAVSKLSAAGLFVAVGFASGTVRAISAAAARHAWAAQNCNEGWVSLLQLHSHYPSPVASGVVLANKVALAVYSWRWAPYVSLVL